MLLPVNLILIILSTPSRRKDKLFDYISVFIHLCTHVSTDPQHTICASWELAGKQVLHNISVCNRSARMQQFCFERLHTGSKSYF